MRICAKSNVVGHLTCEVRIRLETDIVFFQHKKKQSKIFTLKITEMEPRHKEKQRADIARAQQDDSENSSG